MMRTLFLQAPSCDGFDGGAGSRYQARREVRSFWYPTWLAQAAALVPDSKLIDATPHAIDVSAVVNKASQYDLAVLYTSTPSFSSDLCALGALKAANPALKAGFVGAKVAADPAGSLTASASIDFVAGNEFEFTIRDVAEGQDWSRINGLSHRDRLGTIRHNPPRQMLEDMDQLPFVTPIYKRDLTIENYFIGYLRHPYLSFYTGRGCKFALHVLSIAANHWRSSVPHSQRRERHCGDRLGSAGLATGEGVFFDDVHR